MIINLCKCGCGEKVKNVFAKGHHRRNVVCTEETRKSLAIAHVGKIPWNKGHTKETDSRVKTTKAWNKGLTKREHPELNIGRPRIYEPLKSVLCSCGCKQMTTPGSEYISGHNSRKSDFWSRPIKEAILCKCNCGQLTTPGRKFLPGHNFRGITLSKERRQAISVVNKGRIAWNKGKTKKTDARVAAQGKNSGISRLCKPTWNSGLTIETDSRIKPASEETKLSMRIGQKKFYMQHEDEFVRKRMDNFGWHKFPYIFSDGSIIQMRFSWEVLYAKYLDFSGIKWLYEPKQFKLSTGKRYWPDFYLPDLNEYHEVKGWMSQLDKEKMDVFQEEYPDEKLVIILDVPRFLKQFYAKETSNVTL